MHGTIATPAQKQLAALALRQRGALAAFILAVLVLWWAFAAELPPYVLAGPLAVGRQLADFVTSYSLARHALISFAHVGQGLAIAFAIGFALAALAHYAPVFRLAVHQRISPAVNAFPGIGWIMLAIMWFGIGDVTVVFAITATLLPFVMINLREGFDALSADSLEMSRSFTRRRWRSFRLIVLPSLYPFLFSALRIAFGVSWKIALTAELFGGRAGLGFLFNRARQVYDMALILVVISVIIAFVYGMDRLVFKPIQQRLEQQHAR
jgi:NitT/TauT family transport system permease protein/sulfonate transport system permease protein